MGLLDDIRSTKSQHGLRCGIARLLDDLDDVDARDLIEALDAPLAEVQHAQIGAALRARGHDLIDMTVNRHRLDRCTCRARGVVAARLARMEETARAAR